MCYCMCGFQGVAMWLLRGSERFNHIKIGMIGCTGLKLAQANDL